VIDFIDMEEKRNNRAVEKKLKDCFKNDRARIQVGRISPFGLMEMSRQRIRTGVLESSSLPCPHCAGTGSVRATPSIALHILRSLEETLIRNAANNLIVRTRAEVAFYILNQKRVHLHDLEARFGVEIAVAADDTLSGTTVFAVERGEPAPRIEHKGPATGVQIDAIAIDDEVVEAEAPVEAAPREELAESNGEGGGRRRRRRRRRRGRGGEMREGQAQGGGAETEEDFEEIAEGDAGEAAEADTDETEPSLAADDASDGERRRGRRWERRERGHGKRRGEPDAAIASSEPPDQPYRQESFGEVASAPGPIHVPESTEPAYAQPGTFNGEQSPEPAPAAPQPEAAPPAEPEPEPVAVVLTPPDPDRPKRAGWWSRAKTAISGS
jgi:ribonuclease E